MRKTILVKISYAQACEARGIEGRGGGIQGLGTGRLLNLSPVNKNIPVTLYSSTA